METLFHISISIGSGLYTLGLIYAAFVMLKAYSPLGRVDSILSDFALLITTLIIVVLWPIQLLLIWAQKVYEVKTDGKTTLF